MNLLNQQINTKPTSLLNTQPMNIYNGYDNIYQPGIQNFMPTPAVPVAPVVEDPWNYGDAENDPGEQDVGNIEDMTTADLDMAIGQIDTMGPALSLGLPGSGLLSFVTKMAMENEIDSRHAAGADGNGNNNMSDPTAPGGIGGSAGEAASTGSAGHGPDMGGDGGFGLAGGGYVGYAVDGNPNPEQPDGTPRDNVMLPMNTKEGVLPPDVMEYIGVDGLNDFINSIRQKAGQTNKAQDQRSMLLG